MPLLGLAADQPLASLLAEDLSLVVLLALVVRLLPLPLLRRAQQAARERAAASVSGAPPPGCRPRWPRAGGSVGGTCSG